MSRSLVAALFVAGFLAAGIPAQQPKDKKKPERIAVNDLEKLTDDKDFAVQGEYLGEAGTTKVGAQVIARGNGEFDVVAYVGGLPGAGADMKTARKGTAKRAADGPVTVSGKEMSGSIQDGKMQNNDAQLTRTERKSPTLGAKPPEGAVVLFAGPGDEKNWNGGKLVELSDGKFLAVGTKSKQAFGSFKAHVEFRLPWMPNSTGQGRGNSGVYVQDRYEIQVLDSFGLKGENNECGGVYTQHKPKVNMCLPPMVWQTYDLEFTAAGFELGKKIKPARLTLLHNGVKVHDDVELPKECPGGQPETEKPGPFQLQNHGDPVVYRNIWVVEKK
jgi:hypothetical protein